MERTFDTTEQAWLWAVREVHDNGIQSTPRGKSTREIADVVTMRIVKPDECFPMGGTSRTFRHAITAAEGLSLIGQVSVPELILDRVKAFRPFLNGSIFWGAYGPRVAGDLGELVSLLMRDLDSRQAVVSIYDSDRDLGRPEVVDVPCTVALQFRVRGNDLADWRRTPRLDMWTMMRSNDAWLGLPYDFGQFTLLMSVVSWAIGIRMGVYTHSAGSLHLYQRDLEKADHVQAEVNFDGHVGEMAWGAPKGGGVDTMAAISSRCRRILMGQPIDEPTHLETWLARALQS